MGTVHAKSLSSSSSSSSGGLDSMSARVRHVHVEGLRRTKDDYVERHLRDLLKAANFEDMVLRVQQARMDLEDCGCFSSVQALIDTSAGGSGNDYDVTFNVEEGGRVRGKIHTMVGTQEGKLVTGLQFPNVIGRGEAVDLNYVYGTTKNSTFNVGAFKPFSKTTSFTTNVFKEISEMAPCGYRNTSHGLLLDLAFVALNKDFKHNVQYEASWRHLKALSLTTSFATRMQSGHSLKSAVRHILTVDKRDDLVFPTQGSFFRLKQEFAGLGGDIGFMRAEAQVQTNLAIKPVDVVIQGALNCGLVKESSNEKRITILDRLFLGGPLDIRGFELRGLGPESDSDRQGDLAYLASAIHIYTPLPFRPKLGGLGDMCRTHFFVNAGNLGRFDPLNDIYSATRRLRVSCGLGLAVKFGSVARIELNYCVPIRSESGDRVHPGLQFGVGIDAL